MTRFTRWIPLTTACAVIALAGLGVSQTAVRLKPKADALEQGVRLSQALKYDIVIQEDQPAGRVVDFIVSDGGCIDYIVATHEDQYYLIPYPAASFRYDDRLVFVDLAPARFRQVQFFAQDDWPDYYVQSYRQQVFSTFGIDARRGRATFRQNLDDDDDVRDRRDRREENRDLRREQRDVRDRNRDRDNRDRDLDNRDRDFEDRDATRPPVPDRPKQPAAPKADPKTPKPKPAVPAPKQPAPKQP